MFIISGKEIKALKKSLLTIKEVANKSNHSKISFYTDSLHLHNVSVRGTEYIMCVVNIINKDTDFKLKYCVTKEHKEFSKENEIYESEYQDFIKEISSLKRVLNKNKYSIKFIDNEFKIEEVL